MIVAKICLTIEPSKIKEIGRKISYQIWRPFLPVFCSHSNIILGFFLILYRVMLGKNGLALSRLRHFSSFLFTFFYQVGQSCPSWATWHPWGSFQIRAVFSLGIESNLLNPTRHIEDTIKVLPKVYSLFLRLDRNKSVTDFCNEKITFLRLTSSVESYNSASITHDLTQRRQPSCCNKRRLLDQW